MQPVPGIDAVSSEGRTKSLLGESVSMSRPVDRRDVLKVVAASFLLARSRAASAAEAAGAKRWTCTNQDCDPFVYDPTVGAENVTDPDHPIPPGVPFGDLPDDWVCPVCGDPKSHFLPLSR